MNYSTLIKCALFFVLFSGFMCTASKNELTIAEKTSFIGESFKEITIKVFTVNGELSSPEKEDYISRFKNRLTDLESDDYLNGLTVTYFSNDSLILNNVSLNVELISKVHYIGAMEYWESITLTSLLGTVDSAYRHFVYKPLSFEEFSVPPDSNYGYSIKTAYKDCKFATNYGDRIEMIFMDYSLRHSQGERGSRYFSNKFKTDSFNLLNPGDTLMIQEYKLVLN